jgi:Flp pilus assembly protein TadG
VPGRQSALQFALRARAEGGQVVVLVAISLVVLLGFAALAIDVGNAYYAQRALQGSADAAALAGAEVLPNATSARTLALQYGGDTGSKNVHSGLNNVQTDVSVECAPVGSGCQTLNTVVVAEAGQVNSFFARVLGVNVFNIKVRAAACSQGATFVHLIDANGPCPAPVSFNVTQRLTPNDQATVTGSGGPTPTGNVLFQLFDPTDATCSGSPAFVDSKPLSGGEASTLNTSFIASLPTGTWRWKVRYGGDGYYDPADGACGVENFTIFDPQQGTP